MNATTAPLLAATLLLAGCQTKEAKKDPLLDEAARYHTEATRIQQVLEPQIDRIDSLRTVLSARPDPAAKAASATLDSLKKAFESWEANLVEVPGMPHDHAHDHAGHNHEHHHHDNTLKDLPADQMRDLQRELRDNIRQLQQRYDQVLRQIGTP